MAQWVAQLQNGDATAFDEIYQRCCGYVSFVCTKFTDNKEDIEEVVQDTFHIAYKNIHQIQGKAIIPYMRKVAVHECFRRRKINRHYASHTTPDATFDHPELDEALLPEDALQNKERQRQLLLEIDRLPKLQREMVYLYYYADIDAKEIADLMQCTVGSVYSVLTRARKTLRQKLDDDNRRAGRLLAKTVAVLPLAALFLAEESTYVLAFSPPVACAAAAGAVTTSATVATTTTTGTLVGYIAACMVFVGLATGTYIIAFQSAAYDPAPVVYQPTQPTPTMITTATITTTPEPTMATTTAPTTAPFTTPEPTQPPTTTPTPTEPPPITPQPTIPPAPIIPIDRTADILATLSLATTAYDVAHIIATYGFVFETQATAHNDQILRFYLHNEGSGDILIGTSIQANGSGWRMQYIFFDGGDMPFDGVGLYRWMRN